MCSHLFKSYAKIHTQHKYSFEDSENRSHNYAVLGGSEKMSVTRRPDTNWGKSWQKVRLSAVRSRQKCNETMVKCSSLSSLPVLTPSWGTGLRCGVLKRCNRIRQVSLAPGSESCSLQAEVEIRHAFIGTGFLHILWWEFTLFLDRLHDSTTSKLHI